MAGHETRKSRCSPCGGAGATVTSIALLESRYSSRSAIRPCHLASKPTTGQRGRLSTIDSCRSEAGSASIGMSGPSGRIMQCAVLRSVPLGCLGVSLRCRQGVGLTNLHRYYSLPRLAKQISHGVCTTLDSRLAADSASDGLIMCCAGMCVYADCLLCIMSCCATVSSHLK